MNAQLVKVAQELIREDIYEEACEEGLVRWMRATYVDPGCYDRDIDFEFAELVEQIDEDNEPTGDLLMHVVARVSGHVIRSATYTFGQIGHDRHPALRIWEVEDD